MTQEAVFSKDGIKGWILAVMQESAPFCTRYSFCIRNSHPSRSAPDTNPCLVPNPMHSPLFSRIPCQIRMYGGNPNTHRFRTVIQSHAFFLLSPTYTG